MQPSHYQGKVRATLAPFPSVDPKVAEQARDFDAKRYLLGSEKYADIQHAERNIALQNLTTYGSNTIRGMFLLNGGAILALLTFLGSMFGKYDPTITLLAIHLASQVMSAFYLFTGGLIFSVIASGIAYFNWSAITETYPTANETYNFIHARANPPKEKKIYTWTNVTTYAAIACVILSVVCFTVGAYFVASAFDVLGV